MLREKKHAWYKGTPFSPKTGREGSNPSPASSTHLPSSTSSSISGHLDGWVSSWFNLTTTYSWTKESPLKQPWNQIGEHKS